MNQGTRKPPLPRTARRTSSKVANSSSGDARGACVYKAMERMLDGTIASREILMQMVLPFCGLEFLQAAEERSLSSICGLPTCSNAIPSRSNLNAFLLPPDGDNQHPACAFCSAECELGARRIAGWLGDEKAALARFTLHTQSAQNAGDLGKKRSRSPSLAAGDSQRPIMLANVLEKDVEAGSAEPPKASWNTVEGFVPRHVPLNHATQPQDPNIRDLGSAISEMQIEADQAKRGSRLETSDHDLQPIREKDETSSDDESTEEDEEPFVEEVRGSEDESQSDASSQASDTDAWTSGNIPWLDNSITLKDLHLSLFGALHQAIEGLMTDGAVQFCSGQNSLPACSLQDQQFRQVFQLLGRKVTQALTHRLLREVRVTLPIKVISSEMHELLRRLNLTGPIPSLKATGWEVLCVVMLEALSKNRLTELRSNIESRDIDEYLTKFCEQRDLDMCHLSELTAMFLPE